MGKPPSKVANSQNPGYTVMIDPPMFTPDKYESFDSITRKSLIHAAKDAGCLLTEAAIDDIIKLYEYLTVCVVISHTIIVNDRWAEYHFRFDDVPETLSSLARATNGDIKTVIFTNGTSQGAMLDSVVVISEFRH